MSMMVSFVLSFFPRDVLDEILNLIGSVSEGFPSYSHMPYNNALQTAQMTILQHIVVTHRKKEASSGPNKPIFTYRTIYL